MKFSDINWANSGPLYPSTPYASVDLGNPWEDWWNSAKRVGAWAMSPLDPSEKETALGQEATGALNYLKAWPENFANWYNKGAQSLAAPFEYAWDYASKPAGDFRTKWGNQPTPAPANQPMPPIDLFSPRKPGPDINALIQGLQGPSHAGQTFSVPMGEREVLPPSPIAPAPHPIDFTEMNKYLDAARPMADTPEERQNLRMWSILAGLGQGAANANPAQGLGAMLFNIAGSGAAGLGQAGINEQTRTDKYNKEMRDYGGLRANAALNQATSDTTYKNQLEQSRFQTDTLAYERALKQLELDRPKFEGFHNGQVVFRTMTNGKPELKVLDTGLIDRMQENKMALALLGLQMRAAGKTGAASGMSIFDKNLLPNDQPRSWGDVGLMMAYELSERGRLGDMVGADNLKKLQERSLQAVGPMADTKNRDSAYQRGLLGQASVAFIDDGSGQLNMEAVKRAAQLGSPTAIQFLRSMQNGR